MSTRPGRPHEQAAIRITTAGEGPQADLAKRQRKYVIAMTIRTLSFIAAAITGALGWHWVWPFFIAAAVFLPYFAVVAANVGDTRSSDLPLTGGGDAQRQLGPGSSV